MAKINAPVAIEKVYSVLGVAKGERYDVGYICSNSHGKINKWAKYKPEGFCASLDIGKVITPLPEGRRKSNNYALQPDESSLYGSKQEVAEAVRNDTFRSAWIYVAPRDIDFKRLSDFDGYDHEAKAPFGRFAGPNEIVLEEGQNGLLISCTNPLADEGEINLADFNGYFGGVSFKDWYFGIILVSSGNAFLATASKPVKDNDWAVRFSGGSGMEGTWQLVPLLCKYAQTDANDVKDQRFAGIEQQPATIRIVTLGHLLSIIVFVERIKDNTKSLTCKVTIGNDKSKRVLKNVKLIISPTNAANANEYALRSYGDITLASGESWKDEAVYTIGSNGYDTSYYKWARVTFDGGASDWINIMDPYNPGTTTPVTPGGGDVVVIG